MSSAVPTLKVVSGLDPMFITRHPPRPTLAAVVFVSWLLLLLLRIAGSSRQKRTNQSKRRVR